MFFSEAHHLNANENENKISVNKTYFKYVAVLFSKKLKIELKIKKNVRN